MKHIIYIVLLTSTTGCSILRGEDFTPSQVIDKLSSSGCTITQYHQNWKQQRIDISCDTVRQVTYDQ